MVRHTPWPAAAVLIGGLLVCLSFLTLGLTSRTILFWLFADEYVRTTLEVTELVPGTATGSRVTRSSNALLFGVVAATGEEIRTDHIPTELFLHDSPSDAVAPLMEPRQARGKIVEIWFAPNPEWAFAGMTRVQYVSEFETLPSGQRVLGAISICLVLFASGTWLVVHGARRALAGNPPADADAD